MPVGRFGQRQSDDWHRKIDATAAARHPVSSETAQYENGFPWAQLRSHTEIYLSRKSKLTVQEKDARLVALIQNHEAKDIAVAACSHLLTTQTLRTLLTSDLYVEPRGDDLFSYLQAIAAAKKGNIDSVTDSEAYWARAMIPFTTTPYVMDPEYIERTVPSLMMAETGPNMLLHNHINSFTRTACAVFAKQLDNLMLSSFWVRAYTATRWLVPLSHRYLSQNLLDLGLVQVLDSVFPTWHDWAAWQPNLNRLRTWERFTEDQRKAFQHLLAFEGPDFASRSRSTLHEGFVSFGDRPPSSIICRGNVTIRIRSGKATELENILDRLLHLVDSVTQVVRNIPGLHPPLALLTRLCLNNPIDQSVLELLESVNDLGNASTEAAILQLINSRNESEEMQMNAVVSLIQLLPTLGESRGYTLAGIVAPLLSERISSCMQVAQNDLYACLQAGKLWNIEDLKMIPFGIELKQAGWLRSSLDPRLQRLLERWPEMADMAALADLRNSARGQGMTQLIDDIDIHCMDRLVQHLNTSPLTNNLIEVLIRLWQNILDDNRRWLALSVVKNASSPDTALRHLADSQIQVLPLNVAERLWGAVVQDVCTDGSIESAMNCVEFAKLLSAPPLLQACRYWRQRLRAMIEVNKATLIEHTLQRLSAVEWLRWMGYLNILFKDVFGNPFSSPSVPKISLRRWISRLAEHVPAIRWLDEPLKSTPAMKCILTGVGSDNQEDLELAEWLNQILLFFGKTGVGRQKKSMLIILRELERDGSNAEEIFRALSLVADTTEEGDVICNKVFDLQQLSSRRIAETILAGWLQDSNLTRTDKDALREVASIFNFEVDEQGLVSVESLQATSIYFDEQVAELLAEAKRLDGLRLALRAAAIDSDVLSAQLTSLGIENPSLVEDAMAQLPSNLVDVVEKISDKEIELQFPLTKLTALQKLAMSAGESQSLVVRILLGDSELPLGFCVHFDGQETGLEVAGHSPYLMFSDIPAPIMHHCVGKASRATLQISRILFRHFEEGFTSLEDVHGLLTKSLGALGQTCMICGSLHGANLQRSTLCSNSDCVSLFDQVDIEIRLSDIFQDPPAVNALLTMVYATAAAGNMLLLPNCPVNDGPTIVSLINKLPKFNPRHLSPTLNRLDGQTLALLSWICSSYRGFLASATGLLRIPSLPGATQLVLASAAPHLEAAFARHRTSTPSPPAPRVLFHGTNITRLYAILTQGLRVMSGTPLALHGASSGNGIYMAEEPNITWSYSNTQPAPHATWANSNFKSMRVLLGCEWLGAGTASVRSVNNGIHVITDASTLILRYVFLIPMATAAPLAAHITPAMLSAFATLR